MRAGGRRAGPAGGQYGTAAAAGWPVGGRAAGAAARPSCVNTPYIDSDWMNSVCYLDAKVRQSIGRYWFMQYTVPLLCMCVLARVCTARYIVLYLYIGRRPCSPALSPLSTIIQWDRVQNVCVHFECVTRFVRDSVHTDSQSERKRERKRERERERVRKTDRESESYLGVYLHIFAYVQPRLPD